MVILTLNCGSSSVKYQVYDWEKQETSSPRASWSASPSAAPPSPTAQGQDRLRPPARVPDPYRRHRAHPEHPGHPEHGVIKDMSSIKAVGHRVVHGGAKFARSVLIDDDVPRRLQRSDRPRPAPQSRQPHGRRGRPGRPARRSALRHHGYGLASDDARLRLQLRRAPRVAGQIRGAPLRLPRHELPVQRQARRGPPRQGPLRDQPRSSRHIGNGASINAVKNGLSYDTSMGMTPLEGLVMGTRSGDIDPGIVFHMMRKAGL